MTIPITLFGTRKECLPRRKDSQFPHPGYIMRETKTLIIDLNTIKAKKKKFHARTLFLARSVEHLNAKVWNAFATNNYIKK